MAIEVATEKDVVAHNIARSIVGLDEHEAEKVAGLWGDALCTSLGRYDKPAIAAILRLLSLPEALLPFFSHLVGKPSDLETLAVLADCLEESGKVEAAKRYRRIIPGDGDVLVWYHNRHASAEEISGTENAARRLCECLAALGRNVLYVMLPHGADLTTLEEATRRARKASGIEPTSAP